jgi:RNA polymerase sigma-B factor
LSREAFFIGAINQAVQTFLLPAQPSARLRPIFAPYAETRDPALREELVRRLLPLARSLALRYRASSEPLDDLMQVASLGLIKALDGFDPKRGKVFAAYAAPTILGELRRHFRDRVWQLRLPRRLQERTMAVQGAVRKLSDELGRSPRSARSRSA